MVDEHLVIMLKKKKRGGKKSWWSDITKQKVRANSHSTSWHVFPSKFRPCVTSDDLSDHNHLMMAKELQVLTAWFRMDIGLSSMTGDSTHRHYESNLHVSGE